MPVSARSTGCRTCARRAKSKRWREENPEKYRALQRAWEEANPSSSKERARKWREENRERCRENSRAYMKDLKNTDPQGWLLMLARRRAREKGLPFEISREDIIIPERCPVLGVTLRQSTSSDRSCAPSLDRIDSSKGYVPGNVQVISYRANAIKHDATLDELRALVSHLERLKESPSPSKIGKVEES